MSHKKLTFSPLSRILDCMFTQNVSLQKSVEGEMGQTFRALIRLRIDTPPGFGLRVEPLMVHLYRLGLSESGSAHFAGVWFGIFGVADFMPAGAASCSKGPRAM